MALQFQNIPVPFAQGVDTLSDKYQIPVGKLAVLRNALFEKTGSVKVRNGYRMLSPLIVGGGGERLETAKSLVSYNDELVLLDGQRLYSYSETIGEWSDRGYCPNVFGYAIDGASQAASAAEQPINPDVAYYNGFELTVWGTLSYGAKYSLIDTATRTVIVDSAPVYSAHPTRALSPKVVVVGASFLIFWARSDTGFLWVTSVPAANPTAAIPTATTITVDAATPNYDIVVMSFSRVGVIVRPSTSVGFVAYELTFGLGITYSHAVASNVINACAIENGDTAARGYWLAWSQTVGATDGIAVAWWSPATSAYYTAVVTVPSAYYGLVTISPSGTTATVFFEQYSSTGTSDIRSVFGVDVELVSGGVTTGTPWLLRRGVGISSKPFVQDDVIYLPCSSDSTSPVTAGGNGLQSSHYLLTSTGQIAAKHSDGRGAHNRWITQATMASTVEETTGVWTSACLRRTRLVTVDGAVSSVLTQAASVWDFTGDLFSVTLGNELLITSGVLRSYDGTACLEHGFLQYPEITATASTHSGAVTPDVYQYCAVYRYTDAKGQIHDSAPSPPAEVTIVATHTTEVVVTYPRLSEKSRIEVIVFRDRGASSGDATFYKLDSVVVSAGGTVTNTVTIYDTGLYDLTLGSNEFLYTTGGVLENTSPPTGTSVCAAKSRVFVSDGELIWFSKTLQEGHPVEFSDTNYLRLEPRGGEVRAIAAMDSNIIVWKALDAAYQVFGDGPDNLGNGGYAEPVLVSTDVGCSRPESVVLTPEGLVFQAASGLHMLDRSLHVDHFGQALMDEPSSIQTITSGVTVSSLHEVRFLCSDGDMLVWNSLFSQWATHSVQGVSACLWRGVYSYARADGTVWVETEGQHLDGSDPIELLVETPWLNFAGLHPAAATKFDSQSLRSRCLHAGSTGRRGDSATGANRSGYNRPFACVETTSSGSARHCTAIWSCWHSAIAVSRWWCLPLPAGAFTNTKTAAWWARWRARSKPARPANG